MDTHFLSNLVSGDSHFVAEAWYNRDGDCIVYQMADEATIADRIDDVLTIYLSAVDRRPIGYQIKGAAALVKKFGYKGLVVSSKEDEDGLQAVSLSALLLAAYEQGPKTVSRRRGYISAFDTSTQTPRIPAKELELALN